jgi:DNA repair protein RecN (Recombination protein N)
MLGRNKDSLIRLVLPVDHTELRFVLTLLNISNVALIDELQVEFEGGLNLLTGETGSGKSIIVDALGVLVGGRFTSDLLKAGAKRAAIEGLFAVTRSAELEALLSAAGIDLSQEQGSEPATGHELIIRRELSLTGRNKIFINNQLATQSLLRDLRPFLVDIHGQGDQQTLFSPDTHLELLDAFAGVAAQRQAVADCFQRWHDCKSELEELRRDEAARFQLVDMLKFQIDELERAQLVPGEDASLEEERRRLLNVEKLTTLCAESFALVYEDNDAAITRVRQAAKRVAELAEYEESFSAYLEGLESAQAILEDLAFSLRDFGDKLEFSPVRLASIEDRLAELSQLKRKYGGSLGGALEHLARATDRLSQIESSDERERELALQLAAAQADYVARATKLHDDRVRAAAKFAKAVERDLADVAMESAHFRVQITVPEGSGDAVSTGPEAAPGRNEELHFARRGFDRVEFHFSANVGEAVKPLARIASGGEASRLMLVLKTVANASEFPRTIVFDEIDTGIGGRVSEAVGVKLRKLSQTNQVLCVTHQAQIARFADNHLLVQKEAVAGRTVLSSVRLDRRSRVEEIARMLTGADITDNARRHARELLKI